MGPPWQMPCLSAISDGSPCLLRCATGISIVLQPLSVAHPLVQVILVVAALISVPIMLLPKPLVLQKRFKARQAQLEEYGRVSPHDEDEEAGAQGALRMAAPAHAHEEEFDFSEVIVHQVPPNPCLYMPFLHHCKN